MGDEIWWDGKVDNAEAQPILEEFFTLPGQLTEKSKGRRGDDVAPAFWPGRAAPKSGGE